MNRSNKLYLLAATLRTATVVIGLLANVTLAQGEADVMTDQRIFSASSHRTGLILSEIMYNPLGSDDLNGLEFVELFNTDPVDLDLSGYRLSGDVDYLFPSNTVIAARSFVVVARYPSALVAATGLSEVLGPFIGSLSNSGGLVRLRNELDATLLEVNYDTELPWPIAADGAGHSLVLSRPDYGEGVVEAWAASATIGGSPGSADPIVSDPLNNVLINEFLAHTDLPQWDFIELYNHGTQTVDLSGCTLSDKADPSKSKYTIPPATSLPPGGFIAFSETITGIHLSSSGEEIFLRSSDGLRVVDAVRFGAQNNGISTGRYPDGSDAFHRLAANSFAASNAIAGPLVHDIVINEIMYHPISGLDQDEYIELHNKGTESVDIGDWQLVDGVSFIFPPGVSIPAGGYLVVAKDSARLIDNYSQLNTGNTFGDFGGSLANSGERIALAMPDDPLLPTNDLVVVDEVTYGDGDNWGRWADGGGSSLELVDNRSDNRLPMNWRGSDETQKAAWTEIEYTGTIDTGTSGTYWSYEDFRVFHLQAGEFLIDDLEVKVEGGAVCVSSDFESGQGDWEFKGSHVRSSVDANTGVGGGKCLHLRASSNGDNGSHPVFSTDFYKNHATVPMLSIPPLDSTVTVRAKVRWLCGWPRATMDVELWWLEAPIAMEIPKNLGSPGVANSCAAPNAGPAISEVTHQPVLPATGEPVVVTCRVQDPDGVDTVTLAYRIDPSLTYTFVTMSDQGTGSDAIPGDGLFSAAIPGQASGALIAFYVEAAEGGATNTYPEPPPVGVPVRECLVRFDHHKKPGVFPTFSLLMTAANRTRWMTISGSDSEYSNEPIDVTMVFGDYRAVYNCGARYRGVGRQNPDPLTSGAYSIDIPKNEPVLGNNEIKIDQPGQSGADTTRQKELYSYWLMREMEMPSPRVRFVHIQCNGSYRGVHHDFQSPSSDFAESWFGDSDPVLFKAPGWYGDPYEVYEDAAGNKKQSRYRWYHRRTRTNIPSDDFSPVYSLADAFATTDGSTYDARVGAVVDRWGWASHFGICVAENAWDHYGLRYAHNNFSYIPRNDRAWLFLYDMDHVLDDVNSNYADIFPNESLPAQYSTIPARLFGRPAFYRVYWRFMKELVIGPFDPQRSADFMDMWYTIFGTHGVTDNNGSAASSPSALKSWITTRHAYLLEKIEDEALDVPFAITSNSGSGFTTTNHVGTLTGTAPVEVETIRVNGVKHPLTFSSVTQWSLQTALQAGTNSLVITGFDRHGNPFTGASDSITITLTTTPPSPAGHLLLSEIMYHPPEGGEEYLELFNASPTHTLSLAGLRINGIDHTFGGGRFIGPLSRMVVTPNISAYQHSYGNAEVVIGEYNGRLDNDGETLSLWQPASSTNEPGAFPVATLSGTNWWVLLDQVAYSNQLPWSVGADGLGGSLARRQGVGSGNDPSMWYLDFEGTPGMEMDVISIVLSTPRDGAVFTTPLNAVVAADVFSQHSLDTAVVEFFSNGSTSLGEDSSAPYEISLASLSAPGTYYLTAVVTDDYATSTSAVHRIVVQESSTTYKITFNSTAPEGSYAAWPVDTVRIEGGYSISNANNKAFFADNDWTAGGSGQLGIDDDYVVFYSSNNRLPVTIRHASGTPFYVASLIVGAQNVSGSITLTGNYVGGGTVTKTFLADAGTWTTHFDEYTLGRGFTNLASIALLPDNTGKPMFDDITLSTYAPPTYQVLDFNGKAAAAGYTAITTTYIEDGYTVTLMDGAGGIMDRLYSANGYQDLLLFDDDVLTGFTSMSFRFTRNDGRPFNATTLQVGCLGNNTRSLSPFTLTGNKIDGGTVTTNFAPAVGSRTTKMLHGFTRLQSLDYTSTDGSGAGAPVIDDLTLEDCDPIAARGMILMVK